MSPIVGQPATGTHTRCPLCDYGTVQARPRGPAWLVHAASCPDRDEPPTPCMVACDNQDCRRVLDPERVREHGAKTCDDRCRAKAWKQKRSYGLSAVATIPIYGREGIVAHALVDSDDHDRLARYRWHRNPDGYAFRNLKRVGGKRPSPRFMHREVMGLEPGDRRQVDHKHHDTLDNRKSELRITTPAGNGANRKGSSRNSRTGLRGVTFHRPSGLWRATCIIKGKAHSLGYHDTAEEAAATASLFRQMMTPTSARDQPGTRANGSRGSSGLTASVPKLLRVLIRDFGMSEKDARAAIKAALSARQRSEFEARESEPTNERSSNA